jgi:hypothetical protein
LRSFYSINDEANLSGDSKLRLFKFHSEILN